MRSLSEVHVVVVLVYHYFLSSLVYSSAVAPSGPDKRHLAEITGPHKMNIELHFVVAVVIEIQ